MEAHDLPGVLFLGAGLAESCQQFGAVGDGDPFDEHRLLWGDVVEVEELRRVDAFPVGGGPVEMGLGGRCQVVGGGVWAEPAGFSIR